ncbi:hypothetical protein [Heliomicrobium modesticaldum]|uniref:hypothetical protein n=1 Tax=Heliomicrobium modesticaldum TaxID=35701 RepID=UPI0011D1579B|nr:hypothetical protein [Heliomicrobium modesticaldum]
MSLAIALTLPLSMLTNLTAYAIDMDKIPTKMNPGTIITYNLGKEPTVSVDSSVTKTTVTSQKSKNTKEFVDVEGRAAEDAYYNSIKRPSRK